MIYLDNAATTKMTQAALDVYIKTTHEYFANTSSLHEQGEKAKQLLEQCRKEIASIFHSQANEVYFTSGGSESNILALQSLYEANKHHGNHVITSIIEHPSVHSFFHRLEKDGVEVTYLEVDHNGVVSFEHLKSSIRSDTILASIQHVNSEIGTIQDLAKIGKLLREHGILFHSDCVQSFTKIPIHVDEIPIDAISVSSHKVYGPKGVGAVYLSEKTKWSSVHPLTSHEFGFRPGTVNTPGIAAFTTAAIEAVQQSRTSYFQIERLRDLFLQELKEYEQLITIEGAVDSQLPHIVGMGITGIEGQYMLLTLDRFGICISTGSACQAGKQEPSVAMKGLQKTYQEAKRFFRISFGIHNTRDDVMETAKIIKNCIEKKEGMSRD
ncbi:IscS subfamily cysteine desulfurase [Evansella cellulosilytica]|uniref:Cysteine desulfurase n=1 Tax=Evansella cellulosilytica (strain ATCC 21833 / DSM 2522 / FERM P-1141 / JCM 9156 / N-4) TaxID=649639 RepID=E6TUE2_EVAC2|nr:IscS subfamily cysteine desulfurase [Evansella cellulosilytica]ADU29698.1 Cysteine desulfurase [Evansella cellulosilytica DSM 2522]